MAILAAGVLTATSFSPAMIKAESVSAEEAGMAVPADAAGMSVPADAAGALLLIRNASTFRAAYPRP